MTTRRFVATGVAVAFLLAVAATFVASGRPDGLEHVAEQTGIAGQAEQSPAPALGGLTGLLLVMAISGVLFWALRRRGRADAAERDRA